MLVHGFFMSVPDSMLNLNELDPTQTNDLKFVFSSERKGL